MTFGAIAEVYADIAHFCLLTLRYAALGPALVDERQEQRSPRWSSPAKPLEYRRRIWMSSRNRLFSPCGLHDGGAARNLSTAVTSNH